MGERNGRHNQGVPLLQQKIGDTQRVRFQIWNLQILQTAAKCDREKIPKLGEREGEVVGFN